MKIQKTFKYFQHSFKYHFLSFRIYYLSAIYRFIILYLPKNFLKNFLGISGIESSYLETEEHEKKAFWYGKHINEICDKTPWESKCLVRAMTAQRILHFKGIHSTLYLGVNTKNNNLIAHAWIRCGNLYVTGGKGQDFTIVTMFFK